MNWWWKKIPKVSNSNNTVCKCSNFKPATHDNPTFFLQTPTGPQCIVLETEKYSMFIWANQRSSPPPAASLHTDTVPSGLTHRGNRAATRGRLNPRHVMQPEGRADQLSAFSEPRRWSQPRPPPPMQPYCPPTVRATPSSPCFHFRHLSVALLQEAQTYTFLAPDIKAVQCYAHICLA